MGIYGGGGGGLITLSEGLRGVGASLVAQSVKNLFAVQETRFRSLGRKIPWRRMGICNPLHYSCPENPMDRGTWWAAVHGIAKSWVGQSNQHFTSLQWEICACVLSHFSCVRLSMGILQAITISFSRGSSQPRDPTHVSCISCIGRWVLYHKCHLESPVGDTHSCHSSLWSSLFLLK